MTNKTTKKKPHEVLSRVITLGEINDDNVNEVIGIIYEINEEDSKNTTKAAQPIQLVLNSQGGDVYQGFGLVDCIELSKTPVHVTVLGQAMSMALPILLSGHHRSMSQRSTLMYHEISWETGREKLGYHKQEAKEGDRLQRMYDEIVVSKTSVTEKKLKEVRDRNQEWYITAEEALKLGFVDEIL
jgi:ATP-dependent Clp protease protease subunit